jgi:hypothetical protein
MAFRILELFRCPKALEQQQSSSPVHAISLLKVFGKVVCGVAHERWECPVAVIVVAVVYHCMRMLMVMSMTPPNSPTRTLATVVRRKRKRAATVQWPRYPCVCDDRKSQCIRDND